MNFKKGIIIFLFTFSASYVVLDLTSSASLDRGASNIELASTNFLIQSSEAINLENLLEETGTQPEVQTPDPSPKMETKNIASNSIFTPDFTLEIPSIKITAPIIFEPSTDQKKIFQMLENGVVHYAKTSLPGETGTSIILGHSSVYPWYKGKYGYIFSSLEKLNKGDIIRVKNNEKVLNYIVDRSVIFSPESIDPSEMNYLETTSGSSIVLITCWPTGTNSKRIAVKANLVE